MCNTRRLIALYAIIGRPKQVDQVQAFSCSLISCRKSKIGRHIDHAVLMANDYRLIAGAKSRCYLPHHREHRLQIEGRAALNAAMAPLHHRMPVVVGPRGWPAWLAGAEANPATLLGPPPVSE